MSKQMNVFDYLKLLGLRVKDSVTGAEGTVTSISFDLYGCVQAIVTPPANKNKEMAESRWFDTKRLIIKDKKPVMVAPVFDGMILGLERGPAAKPHCSSQPLPND